MCELGETPVKILAETSAVDVDRLANPSRAEVSIDRSEGGQVNDVVKKTSSSGSLLSVIR